MSVTTWTETDPIAGALSRPWMSYANIIAVGAKDAVLSYSSLEVFIFISV